MPKREREVNMKKFLTLWAPVPSKVPAKVRRAADTYTDMALRAETCRHPDAPILRKLGEVLARAAEELEAAIPAPA